MARKDNPDRRPLLYGIAALLILVAALFLFWPRGGNHGSTMTFTPSSSEGEVQAGRMEVPSEQIASSTATNTPGPDSKVAPEDVPAQPIVNNDTHASSTGSSSNHTNSNGTNLSRTRSGGTNSTGENSSAASPSETVSKPATRPVVSPRNSVSASPTLAQPKSSGRYVLYLGSFGSYANAQKQATELKKKGVPADVAQASKPDGTLIYRVRVAYFQGHSKAKAYGDDLKRRLGLGYWIGER